MSNEEKKVTGKTGQEIESSVIDRLKAERTGQREEWSKAGKEDAQKYARDEISYHELNDIIGSDRLTMKGDTKEHVTDKMREYSGDDPSFSPKAYMDGFFDGLREFWEEFGDLIQE